MPKVDLVRHLEEEVSEIRFDESVEERDILPIPGGGPMFGAPGKAPYPLEALLKPGARQISCQYMRIRNMWNRTNVDSKP